MIEKTTFKMANIMNFAGFIKKIVVCHNNPNHKIYTAFYEFF